MTRDTFYWWLRITAIHLSAFNLGWVLHSAIAGMALSGLIGSLAVWAEVTFKSKKPAPETTLCDCGGGREGPHSKNCRLILAWAPYGARK